MKTFLKFGPMKLVMQNTSGDNPNYLNTCSTAREISFNEISAAEGTLSDALKNFRIVFEDQYYFADDIIFLPDMEIASDQTEKLIY